MAKKTIEQQASEALDELVKYLESKGIKESSEEEFNIMSARQNAEQEQDHNFNYGDTSDTKCDCDYITINEQIEEAIANYLNDRKFQQISQDDADKMMATFLNLKGHLCAKVVNVSKLSIPDTYEVRCIEYRGGSGTVDYIVNVKSGEAFRR